jgi:hypothetical protein
VRRRIAAAALTAAIATAAAATIASASSAQAVRVVRCPTTYPFTRHPAAPRTIAVLGAPRSVRGLVAYTNAFIYLIGPAGMSCAGVQAVDGGSIVLAWPHGHRRPGLHARIDGLSISVEPACVGCKAAEVCPLLPRFAAGFGFPCRSSIPPGEQIDVLRPSIVLFEDPPGVAGDGWPSGGPDPANGLVGVATNQEQTVYRATCTLPAGEHSLCTVALNDAIGRYG